MFRSQRVAAVVRAIAFCAAWILFAGGTANSQEIMERGLEGDGGRPKIGLALAGGGARGGAHIGVIRVLEQNRIPIDYIAGTSMGAIVGGLYAMGRTPDEIEEIVHSIDWGSIFEDAIDRQDRSFRRKTDDDLFLIKAKPGFSDGELRLPTGLIRGQKIDLLLSELTMPAAEIDDFDQLSIPFRAVAAEIATGAEVVIGSGNLARAIRASMSIPGAFTPIEIDGLKLVDGGIANNLPISVVRDMGADLIIAVDISTPLKSDEELDSVLAVTRQLTGILTRRNAEAQIATLSDDDLLIIPDVGDLSSRDFSLAVKAIGIGETAAQKHTPRLRTLSLSEREYGRHLAARGKLSDEPPIVNFVRLENDSRIGDEVLKARIDKTQLGEPLDVRVVEENINKMYGLELFQNIRYEVVAENDEPGLKIDVDERSWGPNYFQFGLTLEDNLEGDNSFNLIGSYLRTGVNRLGGELRIAAVIGEDPGILTELYQPLSIRGPWFVQPLAGYGKRNVNVFEMGERISEFRLTEYGATLAAGREIGAWGELRAGLRRLVGEAEIRVGEPAPDFDLDSGEAFARFSIDKLDNVNFPRRGGFLKAEYLLGRRDLGADQDFDQVLFNTFGVKSWNRYSLLGGLRYASTVDGEAPLQNLFRAGGLFTLSGFQSNELTGQHFALLGVAGYREITSGGFLSFYAGASLELGNVFEDESDIDFANGLWAGSLWIGAETPLGPIWFAYGAAEGGNNALYLLVGRQFGRATRSFLRR